MFASWIGAVGSLAGFLSRQGLLARSSHGLAARLGGSPIPVAAPVPQLGAPCAAADCGFNAVCRSGSCRCPPGWDTCGGARCHYLRASHHHCGACGLACPPDRQCVNGVCL